MKPIISLLALLLFLILVFFAVLKGIGISEEFSQAKAEIVSVEFIDSNSHSNPTDNMLYKGSDKNYHYFYHDRLLFQRSYKVVKTELNMVSPREFPISNNMSVVLWGRFDKKTKNWKNN